MIPVPVVTDVDMAFGCIDHMPAYEAVPEAFQRSCTTECKLVEQWFFSGLNETDLARLSPRDGVDGRSALRAIGSIMASWAPKHEHKIAACGYLLHEWFELMPEEKAA